MSPSRANTRILIGLGIVLLTLVVMLAMTWRTWPEPMIDFGGELYVPWQITEGKLLYRDIAYFNGPLSPYLNALVFRVLGVGLMKLVAVNIAILVGVLVMLHRLAAKMSEEITATIACCAFAILLAVGQPGPVGNYNFITPYSHEMTHGLALALAAMLCLVRFMERRKLAWIGASGALVGLVFLTKPEIFLAASIAIAIGALLATRGSKRRWIEMSLFSACGLAVVLLAFGVLSITLSIREAASGMLGAWHWSMDSRISGNPFYQRVRGTFDLDETLQYLFAMTLGYLVLFGLPALVGRFIKPEPSRRPWHLAISFGLVVAILLLFHGSIKWEEAGRPVIFVVIACVAASMSAVVDSRGILKFVFSVFALLMLTKIVLHVQFYHYGFVLAAPALVLTVVALQCWLPGWINRNNGSGALVRGASLAAIVVAAGTYLYFEHLVATHKTIRVGTNGDMFYVPPEGGTVNLILELIQQTPPSATVAVVPQGAMINYLARRGSSIPFIVQMPPEVIIFSHEGIIESFQEHQPDYVVVLQADTSEYGFRGYSVDFGKPIFDWIVQNYEPAQGDLHDPVLKWMLFKRKLNENR